MGKIKSAMPDRTESRQHGRTAARVVWLVARLAIGTAVVCGASPAEILNGQRVVFKRISDGCPKLEQLDKLASDNALHDRGAYYLDFRSADCIEAEPGDEGLNMEFNLAAKSYKIWLNKDQEAYWFRTLAPDGAERFVVP